MEIDFALLSDVAEVVNGKIYLLGGAIDTIWSPQLPVVHNRMSLVIRFMMTPGELDRQHKVEINLITEDGKRLQTVGGDIQVGRNPSLPKGWRQSFVSVLNFNGLKFDNFGDHAFEIMVNGSSMKSVPLRIAQQVKLG
jgi:hypothetical protein